GHLGVLLVPAGQLGEWGRGTHRVAGESGLRIEVGRGTSRGTRRLPAGVIDVVVCTPATAGALPRRSPAPGEDVAGVVRAGAVQRRSALHGENVTAVLLAWPEMWDDEDAASPLMQDLKDTQRLVMTSDPHRAALVERHARRALTLGTVGAAASPVGPVRTVTV